MSNKLRNIGGFSAPYVSPVHFTATYTSSTTITLSGLQIDISDSTQIEYIVQIKSDNTSNTYRNGVYGVTITYSSDVLTIHGAGTPFASGDIYRVGIHATPFGDDLSSGTKLVHVTNPLPDVYTSTQELVAASDVGATDDTWKDQGSEISTAGFKTLSLFVNYTRNHSTGSMLQVLSKHESGGADEYVLETSASYQKEFGDNDIKVVYVFDTTGIPFVQAQTKATDLVGDGTTEGTVTIDYVLVY